MITFFVKQRFIILFFSFYLLFGTSILNARIITSRLVIQKDFILISIPKSGTHLVAKLLTMMTHRDPYGLFNIKSVSNLKYHQFEETVKLCKNNMQFALQHSGHYENFFFRFAKLHPEYLTILQVRDLRDLIVSYVYHKNEEIELALGSKATFSEKLTYVMDSPFSETLKYNIKKAIQWMSKPNVFITRFEDLVGPKGGGSTKKQERTITILANQLGISLKPEIISNIASDLFGNEKGPHVSGNFREGQIGSWKKHFESSHIEIFNQKWKHYQIALGYK